MVRDEVPRQIAATPEKVWSLVADVTRMDQWSPVITRCEWMGDASGPQVGARFVGHNRQTGVRWSPRRGMELTLERIGTIAETET